MRTKTIRLRTPEIQQDLIYLKYYVDDVVNEPFIKRKTPLNVDIENVLTQMKEQVIKNSVNGCVISTKSRVVYDEINFCPIEEIIIKYE